MMMVSDNTILVEGLGNFFKNLVRISAEAGEKLETNVLKIQAELWKSVLMLLPQLQVETLMQLYQQYLERLIFT